MQFGHEVKQCMRACESGQLRWSVSCSCTVLQCDVCVLCMCAHITFFKFGPQVLRERHTETDRQSCACVSGSLYQYLKVSATSKCTFIKQVFPCCFRGALGSHKHEQPVKPAVTSTAPKCMISKDIVY